MSNADCKYSAVAEVLKNPADRALQHTVATVADFMVTLSPIQCCWSQTHIWPFSPILYILTCLDCLTVYNMFIRLLVDPS